MIRARVVDRAPEPPLDAVRAKLRGSDAGIPVLPGIAVRVIEMASHVDTPVWRIAEIVSKDQILAARLLGLANSAYCAPLQAISTIHEAIVRMGTAAVRNLVMTVCFSSRLYDAQVYGAKGRQLIDHGIGTAYLARIVAERAGASPDEAFLYGLLHDIGKLVILKTVYDYRRHVHGVLANDDVAMLVAEEHTEVGGHVLGRWQLPLSIQEPVRHHHDYTAATVHPRPSMVAYFANRLSHRYGFGVDPDPTPLADDPAFRLLSLDETWLADTDQRAPGLFEIARQMLG